MSSVLEPGSLDTLVQRPGPVKAMGGVDDEELLRGIRQGEIDALGLFYHRHGPASLWLASHVVGDRAVAEDVTQAAFASIWCGDGRERTERESVREWVFAIVRDQSLVTVGRGAPSTLAGRGH